MRLQQLSTFFQTTKKYVYADLLYFLTPVFEKLNSEGNYQIDDSGNTKPRLELETQEEQHITREDNNIMKELASPEHKKKQKKKDVPTHILNMLQQREKTTLKPNNDKNDDTKFLLSFRSYMKRMTANQKIDFQLDVLRLVKQINMENYSSASQ